MRATGTAWAQTSAMSPEVVHNVYSPLPDLPRTVDGANPLGLLCPHCERNLAEGAAKLWTIRGFLIFAQFGTVIEFGCMSCLRRRIGENLLLTLLLGWWCIPWGVATPVVAIQNFSLLFSTRKQAGRALRTALEEQGVDVSQLELESYDSLCEYRDFVDLVLGISTAMAWADGHLSEEELLLATLIAVRFGEGLIGADEARRAILCQYRPTANPNAVHIDLRSVALRCGAFVALSHEDTSETDLKVLREWAVWLGFPSEMADEVLEDIRRAAGTLDEDEHEAELQRAREILGVEASIGIIELRKRYRQLIWKYHPDRVDLRERDHANRRTAEINWAYEVLKKQVA